MPLFHLHGLTPEDREATLKGLREEFDRKNADASKEADGKIETRDQKAQDSRNVISDCLESK